MSKTALGLLVIIILVGGAYALLHRRVTPSSTTSNSTSATTVTNNSSATDTGAVTTAPTSATSTSAPAVTSDQTVAYNADGTFSPASITIKAGTTVIFKNDSTTSMWVASDPHPTHTDYPGFDALKGLKQGETYSFTFTKVGTWGYHNHLKPSSRGTIIVQ